MSEEIVPVRKNIKKGLGRGLGSLLGDASATATQEESDDLGFQRVDTIKRPVTNLTTQAMPTESTQLPTIPENARIWTVPIEKIVPNKEQPRKTFDQVRLQELATSIKEKGIILPIIVRKVADGKFEIIAGERRWRAAQLAGQQEVPVIIRQTENREALELALIENIQRQDLNPIEEAEAYSILATRYGLTQQQIAEKVSKDRVTVANLIRLMTLTSEVKSMVKAGELQLGQAKVLLAVDEPELQSKLAKKVVALRLSVRATEKLVAKAKESGDESLDVESNDLSARDIQPLMSELQRILGTKVDIDTVGQRSKVSFHFYSVAELNQFVDRIRKIRT